jgi:hypothetical protein
MGQRTDTLHEGLHENLKRRKAKYLAKMKLVGKKIVKRNTIHFIQNTTFL